MKVLITSDAHDRWDHLEAAIDKGNQAECSVMLFAGDFMSPPGVPILEKFHGHVHFVLGNNDGEQSGLTSMLEERDNITLHYKFGISVFSGVIDGLTFYMNHYDDFVRNAAMTGEHDVCVYGHDHFYHEERLPNGTILLNPGELQGYKTGNVTCMIFDTTTKEVQRIDLPN